MKSYSFVDSECDCDDDHTKLLKAFCVYQKDEILVLLQKFLNMRVKSLTVGMHFIIGGVPSLLKIKLPLEYL